MSTLEIILTFVSTITTSGNFVQFFHNRKRNEFEAIKEHINFLDERIKKLEDLTCYRDDCKNRI